MNKNILRRNKRGLQPISNFWNKNPRRNKEEEEDEFIPITKGLPKGQIVKQNVIIEKN